MFWENLREEEFSSAIEKSKGLCVIPMGCLEKHGQHLPVGTDYFEVTDVTSDAAKIEDVVIFPLGSWVGEVSCFHSFCDPRKAGFLGCIGISQSTLLTVLDEICREIARNGFDKILIVNGHGGNIAMLKHFVRSQTYTAKPYTAMSTFALDFHAMKPSRLIETVKSRRSEFCYITDEDIQTLKNYDKSGYGGSHADFRETSLIMAHDEKLVCKERYESESGESTHISDYLTELGVDVPNAWLVNYPNSYEAYPPYGASATIGRMMRHLCAQRLAKIFNAIKNTDCNFKLM